MKVAIYTIALNEEQFVERWYESAKEADYLLIADTGSNDETVSKAKALGINVVDISIKPWRFDNARNAALDALPDDIDVCIALDMDEVLQPGWREALEAAPTQTTRHRYQYTWSWNEDGTPGLVYGGDKIHARHGYRWKHPVHEVLNALVDEVQNWVELEIHHHPDSSKSRGQYFPLLELAVSEDPDDDRNAFYYARELYFHGHNEKAIAEFKRHLSLPRAVWRPERSASMRYLAKIDIGNQETWLLRSAAESPERREPWVELALYYYGINSWEPCYASAKRALTVTVQPLEYLCEAESWGERPHDIAAIAAFNLGLYEEAVKQGIKAVEINPNDERLTNNLNLFKEKANGNI
jgi:tetratricopeptide (TPR) repeat protein